MTSPSDTAPSAEQRAQTILADGLGAYTALLLDAAAAQTDEQWQSVRGDAIAVLRPLALLATSGLLDQPATQACQLLVADVALIATSRDPEQLPAERLAAPDQLTGLVAHLPAIGIEHR